MSEVVEQLKPLFDNVVLEPIRETNKGGIEIPVSAQHQTLSRAKVIAVGDGKFDVTGQKFVPMTLKIGDIVFNNRYFGIKLKIDAETEFVVMKEEEVRVRLSAAQS